MSHILVILWGIFVTVKGVEIIDQATKTLTASMFTFKDAVSFLLGALLGLAVALLGIFCIYMGFKQKE